MTWDFDTDTPPAPGFYAIHYCWDSEEGSFCGADYWNGTEWSEHLPVTGWSSDTFTTLDEAKEWAETNDCSW